MGQKALSNSFTRTLRAYESEKWMSVALDPANLNQTAYFISLLFQVSTSIKLRFISEIGLDLGLPVSLVVDLTTQHGKPRSAEVREGRSGGGHGERHCSLSYVCLSY